ESKKVNHTDRSGQFNSHMIFGLIAQLAIVFAVTTYLGVDPAVSNLVGIGGAFILRYFLSIRYTWMRSEAPVERLPEVTSSTYRRQWCGWDSRASCRVRASPHSFAAWPPFLAT